MAGIEHQTKELSVATAVLRASLETRSRQAGMAVAAMILNTAFCVVLLGRGVNGFALAALLASATGLLLVRYRIAMRTLRELDSPFAVLQRFDSQFRAVSFLSQTIMGSGIWIVWGANDEISAYVMTLLLCLYATGTMINLSHDYRSFRLTIPLLMVQPIAFWLLSGVDGVVIAVILTGLTVLMISSVASSQRTFEESIRIRYEKHDLLLELQREKENALAALKQAELANRSKSFFMAAASHDLRQPLYAAAILGDTLALHDLPADAARLVAQQRKALTAASGLFDNLLDLSRFESGAIAPTLTAIPMRDLLKEIEAEFSALCLAKGLTLDVSATDHVVRSDYDLLVRMLRNLVSNAIRYTHAGNVRITCEPTPAHLVLTIADTGIGIAPGDQERVFREFVQIDNPQRSRDRGVGLGLAIVRHIALLLGHPLSVDSALGQGTRMSVRLPYAEAAAAAGKPTVVASAPQAELHGRQVWIVEDDSGVRDALAAYFETRKCLWATAGSRRELEELQDITSRLPDYALIDDMLGAGESGLELAQWLSVRMDSRRILMMTGGTDPKRWRELTASGFAVLRKPIQSAALNEWIASVDEEEVTSD